MTNITSLNPTPPRFCDYDPFTSVQYKNVTLYVPQEAVAAYKIKGDWAFWNIQAIEATDIENTVIENAVFENTGLPQVNSTTAIHDLQGRRLSKPQKGLNIINGKKVLVK